MYDYISVFAPDETDFSHNGLRILVPTSCEITEVLILINNNTPAR